MVDQQQNRAKPQPRSFVEHRKLVRRRFVKGAIAALLLVVIVGGWSTLGHLANRFADKVVLYVRVAQLYTREPDERISMPVLNVRKREIADTWQAPRGVDRKHEGQDIFAPQGTQVLSATDGYVMRIGENNLGGKTVSVVGAGARYYYYAHLDRYASELEEGDRVSRQTVLGYVGTTGNAQGTPPHLHFGIYAAGGAINPLPLIVDRNENQPGRVQETAKPTHDIRRTRTRRQG